MRRAASVIAVACLAAGASGCGGGAGDLLALEVSGGFDGQSVRLTVTGDGRGRCGDGPLKVLPSERVIDAREVERELGGLAERGASYDEPGPDRRQFVARTKAGTVRWTEGAAGLPPALPRTALLERQLEQLLC